MVESKSGRTLNEINAYSEKLPKFTSISLNRLAADSERHECSTAQYRAACAEELSPNFGDGGAGQAAAVMG
jgi:hypothetical protein